MRLAAVPKAAERVLHFTCIALHSGLDLGRVRGSGRDYGLKIFPARGRSVVDHPQAGYAPQTGR